MTNVVWEILVEGLIRWGKTSVLQPILPIWEKQLVNKTGSCHAHL